MLADVINQKNLTIETYELNYQADTLTFFKNFASDNYSVLLDSSKSIEHGKDIICTNPLVTFTCNDKKIKWQAKEEKKEIYYGCMFDLLNEWQKKINLPCHDEPFIAGFLGYFSYDFFTPQKKQDIKLPDAVLGLYDCSVIVDHKNKVTNLYFANIAKNHEERKNLLLKYFKTKKTKKNNSFTVSQKITANMDKEQYRSSFLKIKENLYKGNCYQTNFAIKFTRDFSGSPFAMYEKLREKNYAPNAAFCNYNDHQILSLSPERFLKVNKGIIETKPIKGTRRRSLNKKEDEQLKLELINSEKDKAENLMIVDLMRNDLSKCAQINSVKAPKLFAVESFNNVHHLVSTITAKLKEEYNNFDLFKQTFPGGSITGAPKIKAMEIIDELEPSRRHIYCGSIGYFDFSGKMNTNIAIRTILLYQNKMHYWAGGGIVLDSNLEAEYQEIMTKISGIDEALYNPLNNL